MRKQAGCSEDRCSPPPDVGLGRSRSFTCFIHPQNHPQHTTLKHAVLREMTATQRRFRIRAGSYYFPKVAVLPQSGPPKADAFPTANASRTDLADPRERAWPWKPSFGFTVICCILVRFIILSNELFVLLDAQTCTFLPISR
ncbi:hypothetical protein TcasGA2_TC000351 [Tribolium castaneum]|uniref:Uncharacterized protein n=1 Tax=Tribolium castaneum TaxID=7070 RepID=D6WAS1_TRICA|nr:hypothetical protein TcasGA2_TC000351 [Tribolium castaneum]